MSKPFDATLKTLVESEPRSWLRLLNLTGEHPTIIDADVSTVTGATDKVIYVEDEPAWILHLDFQTGPDAELPKRLRTYSALLSHRHSVPIYSVGVLLRSSANRSNLTGEYTEAFPNRPPYGIFRYEIIRVWELDIDRLFECGVGTLPLVSLAQVNEEQLPSIIERLRDAYRQSIEEKEIQTDLWVATSVLMGLRYSAALIDQLLSEVLGMEDSSVYQAILEKGEARGEARGQLLGARRMLLRVGGQQFGEPSAEELQQIEAIDNVEQLEEMALKVREAGSWAELLQKPE